MPAGMPLSMAGAAWFRAPGVARVFSALDQNGDETRIVGGAVRDALAGRPIGDIDFATTATPETVAARAAAAGLRTIPTGIDHGTQTLLAEGTRYEVTTLREDIETDGRHAVVRYGRDWTKDAERRDFTVNALSIDAAGRIHDPLGGYPDVLARRIRFIGDADRRIAEDRLRALRFFRFNAQFGNGTWDREGLAAAIRARHGLRDLSAERVGQEMRRLVMAPRVSETLSIMQDGGILPVIFGGVAYLGPLSRLLAFEAAANCAPMVSLRIAAAGCRVREDSERIAARLRLPNAERDLMVAALDAALCAPSPDDGISTRRFLYAHGEDVFRAAMALAFAWTDGTDETGYARAAGLPERWPRPRFPLSGRDVLGAGGAHGPTVGKLLRTIEAWWIAEDFRPDEHALRLRLQQMMAASQ